VVHCALMAVGVADLMLWVDVWTELMENKEADRSSAVVAAAVAAATGGSGAMACVAAGSDADGVVDAGACSGAASWTQLLQ